MGFRKRSYRVAFPGRLILVGALVCVGVLPRTGPRGEIPAPDSRAAQADVLANLENGNPLLRNLRAEIADNLKATARRGTLRWPIRYLKYRVRPGENFYAIMAKVSQDADTLASLNGLANPNALGAGEDLLIPNARGLFLKAKDPAAIARRYELSPEAVRRAGDFWFLAGQKYQAREMAYFRGEGFIAPLKVGRISSRYGMRSDPFTRRPTFHGGLDIAAPDGTPVHASQGGKIVRVGSRVQGYGKLIVIEHDFGYRTYYGHLSAIHVRRGQTVSADQIIGRVGSTGRATGPHLHFEVRKHGQRKNPRVHGLRLD